MRVAEAYLVAELLTVVMIEAVYSSLQLPGLSAVFGAWHVSTRLERMVHRRDGHGLGPSMGWVGLGRVAF